MAVKGSEDNIPFRQRDGVVDDGAGLGVLHLPSTLHEDPRVNPLVDDDEAELRRSILSELAVNAPKFLLQSAHFRFVHVLDLSIADTVAVEEDALG